MSNWLHKQVSLYRTHSDNVGHPATFNEILRSKFSQDMKTIIALRKLDRTSGTYDIEKLNLKRKLQCYTPAALLETKAKGGLKEISRSGIMQLDFDYKDICEFDVQELKRAVFDLPSVAFCGLSCSGDGFYTLILISDPGRLTEYAEHCFEYFKKHGVKPDESKGKKPENLRYLSYDSNMLIRENPVALQIEAFKKKQVLQDISQPIYYKPTRTTNILVAKAITSIQQAQKGERWAIVQKVAFTIGGLNEPLYLDELINAINSNSAFKGQEQKYITCARECFNAGFNRPLL